MPEVLAILAAIEASQTAISGLVRIAKIAQTEGRITPQQMQLIKDRAGISDNAWDQVVKEAEAEILARSGAGPRSA